MEIHSFLSGNLNCYILKSMKSIVLINSGVSSDKNFIKKLTQFVNPASIDIVILTSGHYDHVGNAKLLQEQFGVKVLMHKLDVPMIQKGGRLEIGVFDKIFPFSGKRKLFSAFKPDFVMEGQYTEMTFPEITILHLPGHTKGSIGVIWNRDLFAGDLYQNKMDRFTDLEILEKSKDQVKNFRRIEKCYGSIGRGFFMSISHDERKLGGKTAS